jgi:hypothetical protein
MKTLLIIIASLASISANAEIIGFNELVINFTNPTVAVTNVTWSEPDNFLVSTNGFGWGNGETNKYRDFWIQSIPVAIGTSWRPAKGTYVSIRIDPQKKPIVSDNGRTYSLNDSHVYARYSPDKKHWSSWQALGEPIDLETNRSFQGLIELPRIEQENYDKLISQYSRMDAMWGSDEEAAVKWILQTEPDFFEKQLPFVGYVQFRVEGSMPGNERISRIKMQLSWAVGGLHTIPKNTDDGKNRDGVWRFEAP